MPICFWRHGQPDFEEGGDDPGLSEMGREQATRATKEIAARAKKAEINAFKLLASPRKRCQETIEFLSNRLRIPVQTTEELKLRDSWESSTSFTERLSTLLETLRTVGETELVVLCTHADVLDFYLSSFRGPRTEIRKANFFWVSGGRVNEVNPLPF
jgi:broad specificity phosphatase PhoE